MQTEIAVFAIAVLIFSVVIHEVSHGYVAGMLGDPTARMAGRLTLNPIKHLDPLGSVIIPLLFIVSGTSIVLGWAKPVPYNPYNLRKRWGDAAVAAAGPGSNILIAIIFGLLIRFGVFASAPLVTAASVIVLINLVLAFFNLIPIPPLDGSKLVLYALPAKYQYKYSSLQYMIGQYGFLFTLVFILLFVTLLWPVFSAIISWLFTLLTGMGGI